MLPVYVEIFRCNKKHSVTLCFLGEKKGGEEGVFCELRVAKVTFEQECFASKCFVAWSVSHLSLRALPMLLCFVSVCEVRFLFASFYLGNVYPPREGSNRLL